MPLEKRCVAPGGALDPSWGWRGQAGDVMAWACRGHRALLGGWRPAEALPPTLRKPDAAPQLFATEPRR